MSTNDYDGLLVVGKINASLTKPGRKITDDFLGECVHRVNEALSYAKENNLRPVFLGGLTKKVFEVKVLSALMKEFIGANAIILADAKDCLTNSSIINPNSTLGIISSAQVATVVTDRGIIGNIKTGSKVIELYAVPETASIPTSLGVTEGLGMDNNAVMLTSIEIKEHTCNQDESASIEAFEIWGCGVVFNGKSALPGTTEAGGTNWVNAGALVRTLVEEESARPTLWHWTPENGPRPIELDSEEYVFDHSGIDITKDTAIVTDSDFASILKRETAKLSDVNDDESTLKEVAIDVISDLKPNEEATKIITGLVSEVMESQKEVPQLF